MTLADDLKPMASAIRAIPGILGIRPYTVFVVVSTWPGTNTGRGVAVRSSTQILEANGQSPKVRELNAEELALNNIGNGSLKIGPITPAFPGGGTDISVLKPILLDQQTVHMMLDGPGFPPDSYYKIKDIQTDHALHWTVIVEPVQAAP